MPLPRFEVATGAIDGANTIFFVSTPYLPGTLAAFLNGQLKRADYNDGWLEAGPIAGRFDLKQPPETGDVVQAFFIDTSPVMVGEEVTAIQGTISDLDTISGLISAPVSILGAVDAPFEMSGVVLGLTSVFGAVDNVTEVEGLLEVCNG